MMSQNELFKLLDNHDLFIDQVKNLKKIALKFKNGTHKNIIKTIGPEKNQIEKLKEQQKQLSNQDIF